MSSRDSDDHPRYGELDASGEHARRWIDAFDDGGRFEASYDPAAVTATSRAATRTALLGTAIAGLFVAVGVVFAIAGRPGVLPAVGIVVLVYLIALVIVLPRFRRRLVAYVGPEPGLALAISRAGIQTPATGVIAWDELIGVAIVERSAADRERIARGRGPSGALRRLSGRLGDGTQSVLLLVRDGPALRARMDPGRAPVVKLWYLPDAARPGDIRVYLDPLLPQPVIDELKLVTYLAAQHYGVPVLATESAKDYTTFLTKVTG
jgi:hypothetical protein